MDGKFQAKHKKKLSLYGRNWVIYRKDIYHALAKAIEKINKVSVRLEERNLIRDL